jgi:hypothetical protein
MKGGHTLRRRESLWRLPRERRNLSENLLEAG